jgi:hypothetical protein
MKDIVKRHSKSFKMQGARVFCSEAYLRYVGTTKDEAQHRRWAFYEAVKTGQEVKPFKRREITWH